MENDLGALGAERDALKADLAALERRFQQDVDRLVGQNERMHDALEDLQNEAAAAKAELVAKNEDLRRQAEEEKTAHAQELEEARAAAEERREEATALRRERDELLAALATQRQGALLALGAVAKGLQEELGRSRLEAGQAAEEAAAKLRAQRRVAVKRVTAIKARMRRRVEAVKASCERRLAGAHAKGERLAAEVAAARHQFASKCAQGLSLIRDAVVEGSCSDADDDGADAGSDAGDPVSADVVSTPTDAKPNLNRFAWMGAGASSSDESSSSSSSRDSCSGDIPSNSLADVTAPAGSNTGSVPAGAPASVTVANADGGSRGAGAAPPESSQLVDGAHTLVGSGAAATNGACGPLESTVLCHSFSACADALAAAGAAARGEVEGATAGGSKQLLRRGVKHMVKGALCKAKAVCRAALTASRWCAAGDAL